MLYLPIDAHYSFEGAGSLLDATFMLLANFGALHDVTFQIIHRKFFGCGGVAIVSEIGVVLLARVAERMKAEIDRHWCSTPCP